MALLVVSCFALVFSAAVAGCGDAGDGGASAEELAAWAGSVDTAAAQFDERAAVYADVVASVEDAADDNAAALETWDKQWKKRKAAYEKKLNEVEKHNASERAKVAANPTRTEKGLPRVEIIFEGDVTEGSTLVVHEAPAITIQGYTPQYLSMPAKPRPPAKVKVKLQREIKKLKKLEKQLGELDAQLAALVVGDEFAEPLGDLRAAVTDLQAQTAAARRALKKAVRKDKKRGDVIVAEKLAGIDAAAVTAAVAALREALAEAADEAGASDALTWAAGAAAGVASPSISGSPTP